MSVQILCPKCAASYSVSGQSLGRSARCKRCGQMFSLSQPPDRDDPERAAGATDQAGTVTDASASSSGTRETGQTGPYRPEEGTGGSRPASAAAERRRNAPRELPDQFGRYHILKKLGQGGMGTVYLAHDAQLDRQVALKIPHFTPADGPHVIERFYREARAAATFNHPSLCPVFDVGQIDGTHYLTMAFIEGRPLSAFLRRDKPLPPHQVAAVVRKLALALQEAHARGVIHRDLKPSNVMLNQQKAPVIMDFGLARRIDKADARLTASGALLGTPAYMAPEQVNGKTESVGPACDIYSLGVILYELLTGQLPFEGPVLAILAQKILTEDPEPPSAHRPDLDPRLEAVCLKAMAKKVETRYATMAELAAALADYLRSAGQPPGPSEALTWSPRVPGDARKTLRPAVSEDSYALAPEKPPPAASCDKTPPPPPPPRIPKTPPGATFPARGFGNVAPGGVFGTQGGRRRRKKQRQRSPALWIGSGVGAALLVVGVVLGVCLYRGRSPQSPPSEPAATVARNGEPPAAAVPSPQPPRPLPEAGPGGRTTDKPLPGPAAEPAPADAGPPAEAAPAEPAPAEPAPPAPAEGTFALRLVRYGPASVATSSIQQKPLAGAIIEFDPLIDQARFFVDASTVTGVRTNGQRVKPILAFIAAGKKGLAGVVTKKGAQTITCAITLAGTRLTFDQLSLDMVSRDWVLLPLLLKEGPGLEYEFRKNVRVQFGFVFATAADSLREVTLAGATLPLSPAGLKQPPVVARLPQPVPAPPAPTEPPPAPPGTGPAAPDTLAVGAVYHYKPTIAPLGVSRHLRITENKDGTTTATALIDGAGVALAIGADGQRKGVPDAPGSIDLHVVVNRNLGYTTFAGLRFLHNATVDIWDDGTIKVHRVGIQARDAAGNLYTAQRRKLRGRFAIVMVKTRAASPAPATRPAARGGAAETVYHFKAPGPAEQPARNVRVTTMDSGQPSVSVIGDGRIGTYRSGPGQVTFAGDVLGSTGVVIAVNKKLGYTRAAGLRFAKDATVNIWADGVVEVDRVGVPARDAAGTAYSSRRTTVKGRQAIVMVRAN